MKCKYVSVVAATLLCMLCVQCGKSPSVSGLDTLRLDVGDSLTELPLPEIPDSIKDPQQRADIVVTHFWDKMNFRDTLRSHNENFLEQNFANYLGFAVYADSLVYKKSVANLLKKARADEQSFNNITHLADLYLYNTDSPMYSEELYVPFLEEQMKYPFPDEETQLRRKLQLEDISKNRPGMPAADFTFETSDGKRLSLSKTPQTRETLLIFYNPDCDHCKDTMKKLSDSKIMKQRVKDGDLSIVAVYSGTDKAFWKKNLSEFPSYWTIGYEPGNIETEGLYSIRVSPTMYLLDQEKRVLIKDISLQQLIGE